MPTWESTEKKDAPKLNFMEPGEGDPRRGKTKGDKNKGVTINNIRD